MIAFKKYIDENIKYANIIHINFNLPEFDLKRKYMMEITILIVSSSPMYYLKMEYLTQLSLARMNPDIHVIMPFSLEKSLMKNA